jgi:oxaloacetate decarboxylase gamma subunit
MGNEILNQGLTLMLAGMGTVFAFLTVLVFAMTVMSRVIAFFQGRSASDDATEEEIAAISAAVSRHRGQ